MNETGRERARAVERRLANLSVSKVMVSPLKRAMETATLAFPNSSALIQVERDLIECDFGSLEGKHIKDAMNEYCITRKEQLAEILPTYGELWSAVLKRYKALLAKIAALQRFGPTVVLVGHDAVLQGI